MTDPDGTVSLVGAEPTARQRKLQQREQERQAAETEAQAGEVRATVHLLDGSKIPAGQMTTLALDALQAKVDARLASAGDEQERRTLRVGQNIVPAQMVVRISWVVAE